MTDSDRDDRYRNARTDRGDDHDDRYDDRYDPHGERDRRRDPPRERDDRRRRGRRDGERPRGRDDSRRVREAEKYVRYSSYIWLFQAAVGAFLTLFLAFVAGDSVGGGLLVGAGAGVFFVGLPGLLYYGLKQHSKVAWITHMGLSLLAATSLVGVLGLYFGYKGREAVFGYRHRS